MKESFVIYNGFYDPIKALSNEDLGKLFRWIFEYQINGLEPSNTDSVFIAFQFFKNQFRIDDAKYERVVNKDKSIELRKEKFASTLEPFLPIYGKEILNEFYKYWTEPNKSNTKFKQELEKTWSLERRLETWAKNDKNFSRKETTPQQPTITYKKL